MSDSSNVKKLGIIAGAGNLPLIVAGEAKNQGKEVISIGLENLADAELEGMSNSFATIDIGQLLKCLDFLKSNGAEEVVLCGHIDHREVFKNHNFDELMLSILQQEDKRAESLLGRITSEIAAEGLPVADIRNYLGKHLVQEGVLGSVQPKEEQLKDIPFGWKLASQIANLNIGQTVMMKDGVVLAVEAVEGTDNMIKRTAGFGLSETTVVKLPVHNKNARFDLPVIGSKTIESMIEAKASLLAVAAGQTIIIDPEECTAKADKAGIAIIAKDLNWLEK